MSIFLDLLFGSSAKKAELKALQNGKSPDQKRVIEFFASDIGGCLSGHSSLNMNLYQQMVMDRYNTIDFRSRAIEKIGLDLSEISEIPPICLLGYKYTGDCFVKVENDVAVSSLYSVTWLFFSATQIYTYQYIFDMVSDDVIEITHDFFYQDISCFTTINQVVENLVDKKGGCGCLSMFQSDTKYKQNYVVDTLEINVPGVEYSVSMRNAGDVVNSINAAKAMLREKKFEK